MSNGSIYLDHAAATSIDERVAAAMQPYLSDVFYNPSATYQAGRQAKQALEAARGQIAHWLGAKPSEIIFTSGGTEANNLTIHGIMQQHAQGNIIVSAIEHESVLEPAGRYERRLAPVTADGRVDLARLKELINGQTVLVSIMQANNEIGTLQPLRAISQLLQQIRESRGAAGNQTPLLFHTDACQGAPYLDVHTARLGVDLLTLNGGKLYGPKQTGALFVRSGVQLQPILQGGGQERGVRSGTENVAGAVGLAAALDVAQTGLKAESERLVQLQQLFFELLAQQIPTAVINGSRRYRLPNNVHVTLPGQDNERLLFALDEAGIMAAAGSACSASNDEPSHVLRALGIKPADARASLRFTMGRSTQAADIEQAVSVLSTLIQP